MNKISKLQIFRTFIQVIFLIVLPGLFTLTFNGLKQFYLMMISGDFNFAKLLPSIVETLAIIPITILLGRFFCGWFCAFGTFNHFIYLISSKVFKVKFRINEKLDSILKYLKYALLLFIVTVMWTKGNQLLTALNPWDAFAQISNFPEAVYQYGAGFLVLALIAAGAMFIERFFCRYLCPLGAVFSIMPNAGIFKINKFADKCGKCRVCTDNCPMGIKLYRMDKVRGGECINCFKCIQACPGKKPQANICGENLNASMAGAVAITAFTGVYSITNLMGSCAGADISAAASKADSAQITTNSGLSSNKDNESVNANSQDTVSSTNSSQQRKYKDGTYTGVGCGYRPNLTVSVTVKSDKITNIEILSNNETPRYADLPFKIVPQEIIASQSTDVDAVSGATRTSNGIMMAVENALSKAQISSTATADNTSTGSNSCSYLVNE